MNEVGNAQKFAVPNLLVPPPAMRNHAENEYLASAVHVIGLVDELAGIASTARVLDVGCAAGRLALPLLGHLDPEAGGSYDGFDVKQDRVDWARRHVSTFYPHFRFEFIDVRNTALNPSGKVDGSSLSFPYGDGQFDVVLLHSVFTHLLPGETWNYLAELQRCLAPGGRIYSTWYLWDDPTAESVRSNDVLWNFPVSREGHRVMDAARPELAVAYVYDGLLREVNRNGLRVATERRGTWRVKATHDQDILILVDRDPRRAPGSP